MASPAVMSSESAKTFGFMMRPAVCSAYSSSSPTSSPGRFSISSRTAADTGSGRLSMIAAASSDGRSCSRRAISSAERSASSAAPPSGPSSERASIASLLLRSTSTANAALRSFSASSAKTWARSAGCCFWSRLTRFAVAPRRIRRRTESRTTSILRWAMRSAQFTMRLSGFRSAAGRTPALFADARFFHALDAGLLDLVVGRDHEQRAVRLGADNVLQPVDRLAGARIGVPREDEHAELGRLPLFGGDGDRLLVADLPGGDRRRGLAALDVEALDDLVLERRVRLVAGRHHRRHRAARDHPAASVAARRATGTAGSRHGADRHLFLRDLFLHLDLVFLAHRGDLLGQRLVELHLPALFGRRDFELAEDCAGDADRGTPRDLVLGVERVRITRHRIDDRHARPGAGEPDSRVAASAVRLGGEQPEVALFFAARQ